MNRNQHPALVATAAVRAGVALMNASRAPRADDQAARADDDATLVDLVAGAAAHYVISAVISAVENSPQAIDPLWTAHQAAQIALHTPTTYILQAHIVASHLLGDSPMVEHLQEHAHQALQETAVLEGLGLVTRPRAGWSLTDGDLHSRQTRHWQAPAGVPSFAWGLSDEPTDAMRASRRPIKYMVWAGARPLIDAPPQYSAEDAQW